MHLSAASRVGFIFIGFESFAPISVLILVRIWSALFHVASCTLAPPSPEWTMGKKTPLPRDGGSQGGAHCDPASQRLPYD